MSLRRRSTVQDELLAGPRPSAPPHRPHRKRKRINRGKALRFLGIAVLSMAILYGGLILLVKGERLRPGVEAALSQATGRRVELRTLSFSLRRLALVGRDLTVGEDPAFDRVPFLQSKGVVLRVALLPLIFAHRVEVAGISLDSPIIVFKQDTAGNWNYYSILRAGTQSTAGFHSPSIRITGGRLSIAGMPGDGHGIRLRDLELSAPSIAVQTTVPFTFTANAEGGGAVKLGGTAGPMEWNGTSPAIPVSGLVHVTNFNLTQANLLPNSPSLAGTLSLDATVESDGRVLRMDGQVKGSKLKLSANGAPAPDILRAVFTVSHDLDRHSGVLNRFDLSVSKGTAGMTGKYVSSQSLLVNLALSVAGAPVTDLAPILPAVGFPLPPGAGLVGGVVSADVKFEGPLNGPLTNGSIDVNGTRLTGFDLSKRLTTVEGLDASDLNQAIEIVSWKTRLKTGASGLGLEDLQVAVAGLGALSGAGTIDADGSLHFKMSGIRGLTGPKGTPIPFTVQGKCTDPVFRPAPRS